MTHTETAGQPAGDVATNQAGHVKSSLPILVLGALGVVFGDIGTSPLYAFREALHATTHGGQTVAGYDEVLGLLSLIVWALTLIVTVKYVGFVLRADNNGEGGTLSLMSLARRAVKSNRGVVLALGLVGAALFFGDAIITPAISVLSAVEGLQVVEPRLTRWIVPITLLIICALFMVQRFGTGKVAAVFGPVTAIWFLSLGVSGTVHIIEAPQVLFAINPFYGLTFVINHLGISLVVLGAVFLAVTGAEALYVDLGHFGRKPIVLGWLLIVFPCLLLNYFGQGAYVLAHPHAAENPFFLMQPEWARIPIVILATMATVIASQAVISGAYSLARQATNLNLFPRLNVLHTSETQSGQIYMPQINTMLFIAVMVLVIGFQSSSALSAAYGIAVTGEMLVTAILLFIIMRGIWGWKLLSALAVVVPLGLIDLGFFVANLAKFFQGGWVPAVVATMLVIIMVTWMTGRRRLAEKTRRDEVPLEFLVENLAKKKPTTVPGTAVFLTSDVEGAPTALLHSLKHYKVLHEQNVILTVRTSTSPRVPDDEKVTIDAYNELFSRVVVTFGFMETPNIPKALALGRKLGWKFDIMSTSFFLSRRSLKLGQKSGPLRFWQDRLFIRLARNASDATEYFHIPTGRVVEIGTQVII
ncbi:potassium transporter Kup [Devosia sp. XJ19-1]|uniref:Probable potassium transport system protein Kup n=1 Tax=Devosia ureilytica TaxID=2952754 RepID=A0A9Q4AP90_9HYPH|nr:potassium transporter Kup [Devosia ureilytica]MCP8883598.1 potassium transporter Kup [Devosia ureilytica]MCP8887206.1 potassium transporter Kup [Devosia ureilytica]